MTTRSGARIYHRAPKPLDPGACAHCGRVVDVGSTGRRRTHNNREGRRCTGSRVQVRVLASAVALPPIVMPPTRTVRRASNDLSIDDPGVCICGQRPRRKSNGEFAAHRTDVEDWTSGYCPGGATRSR